jgi:hypothetical protein
VDIAPSPHELLELAQKVALNMETTRAWSAWHAMSIDLALRLFPKPGSNFGSVVLVVDTSVSITTVTLSGPACSGARVRCIPADFDNQVHDQCNRLQIEAKTIGQCVVDLDLAGTTVRIEREMVKMAYCDDFVISAGEVDLRAAPEGGTDADANVPDGG